MKKNNLKRAGRKRHQLEGEKKYTNQIRLEQIEIHRDRKRRQQRMGQETQRIKQLEMETYSYCVHCTLYSTYNGWERESEGIERDIVKPIVTVYLVGKGKVRVQRETL